MVEDNIIKGKVRSNNAKGKRVLHPKPSTQKHHRRHGGKIWRRSCRIQLPFSCVARIFKLTNKLGLKYHGKTIEWMLSQLDQNILPRDSKISAANAEIHENPNPSNDPSSPIFTSCQPQPSAADEHDQVPNAEMLPSNPSNDQAPTAEMLSPNPDNGQGDDDWPETEFFSLEDIVLLRTVFGFE